MAERHARNQGTSCSVVKSTLNQFFKPEGVVLRGTLNRIVKEVNRAVAEGYVLANLHVLRMIGAGTPLGPLDQSFFYGCLSAVTRGARRKPEIKDVNFRASVEVYRSWAEECPGHAPASSEHLASGFHQQASQQMATNTRVAVSENFERRFKRYLKHRHGLNGDTPWRTLRAILADDYAGADPLVQEYRDLMPPHPLPPGSGRREDHPHLMMPLLHRFLRYFEERQQQAAEAGERPQKGLRLFSLVPTKQGFGCSYVKLCNNGLYGLLKLAGLDVQVSNGNAEWRAVAPSLLEALLPRREV